jgi:exodeoxyribonuclease VII small subunit
MSNSKRKTAAGKRGRGNAADDAPNPVPPPSFESALEQLEGSVARLEEGEMPLEEALEIFEAGVKLSRQCQSTLEDAERRIEILVADRASESGGIERVAFESEEDADDESEFED